MNKMLCSGIVAIAMSAAPVFAAGQTATSKRAPVDKTFVTKAAQGGMAEVQLGKLAADKASSTEVKQFGQKMVDDHGKANDHRQDVNEFKTESKYGADADIKSWASNTLPTLETHLKMAQDANRAVGTSGVKK
jgi:putative membrane protein